MTHRLAILAIGIIAALAACSPPANEFSDFTRLDNDSWVYGDTLLFIPDITDSIADGTVKVAVCHNNAYEYSSLWLEVFFPAGEGVYRDTIQLVLADKYGHWQGTGIGSEFQYQTKLPGKVRLHRGTAVGVRHIMRVDTLRNIQKVGLTFSPD